MSGTALARARASLRRLRRRIHRSRRGVVIEQICFVTAVVVPVMIAVPVMIEAFERFFYRIAATVTGPFT